MSSSGGPWWGTQLRPPQGEQCPPPWNGAAYVCTLTVPLAAQTSAASSAYLAPVIMIIDFNFKQWSNIHSLTITSLHCTLRMFSVLSCTWTTMDTLESNLLLILNIKYRYIHVQLFMKVLSVKIVQTYILACKYIYQMNRVWHILNIITRIKLLQWLVGVCSSIYMHFQAYSLLQIISSIKFGYINSTTGNAEQWWLLRLVRVSLLTTITRIYSLDKHLSQRKSDSLAVHIQWPPTLDMVNSWSLLILPRLEVHGPNYWPVQLFQAVWNKTLFYLLNRARIRTKLL